MWTWTAIALLICLAGPFVCVVRGDATVRLAGLQGASSITAIVLLVLTEAFQRPPFADLALTLAILNFGAGLVFARFLERWL